MSDRELTLPSSDTHAARRHLGAALVRLVHDLQRAPLPSEPIAAADARAVLALVGPLSRAQPGVVWAALRRPSVYTHLRLAADRHPDPAVLLTGLTTFAAELAASGALGEPLVIQRPPPRLLLRSRLEEVRPSPEAPLRLERSGALLQRGSPCPRRAGFLPISHGLALALADDNPLASVEAHPDKSGSGLDLGEAPAERWLASLEASLAMVERALPVLREELELVLSTIVPVGTHDQRHLSASYREALGTIYLSLHPQVLTMAEAVVHEAQHNKLHAVLMEDPLLQNGPDERYPSPVRPDPRPLLGVLLAVHAFVPVALLHRSLQRLGDPAVSAPPARARLAAIVTGNAEGLALLERYGRPTPLGAALLRGLRELHEECASSG